MGFSIPEKMQNWHTWEDIVKDSDPFLDYLSTKFTNGDFSFLAEVDDLKKVVARLQVEFDKVLEEGRPAREEALAAAVDEMIEIFKMIEDWDKFEYLLTSETTLNDLQKSFIKREWKIQRLSHTKVVKCLGSETIEECLKRKIDEVSEARIKATQLEPRIRMISNSVHRAENLKHWIEMYTDEYGCYPPPFLSPSPPSSPSTSPPPSPS